MEKQRRQTDTTDIEKERQPDNRRRRRQAEQYAHLSFIETDAHFKIHSRPSDRGKEDDRTTIMLH